jgi:hypothetical protein
MKEHYVGQAAKPRNRLQEWAFKKDLTTGYQFCNAMVEHNIVSHGTAVEKWNSGRAGKTQYDKLLAIARFLGASTVEEVFDH